MRKKSLATRLFGYLSLMLCVLVVIIGSFYWVQSSELFHREVEEHTIHEIDTSAKYIEQYVSNLKSTSIALAQSKEIQTYAQNDHTNNKDAIHQLFDTILKSHPDFRAILFVTKDGRILKTGMDEEMVTSTDMMAQGWYKEAILKSNTPIIKSTKNNSNQVVISISQEIKGEDGQHLGVIRLDVDYQELEKYVKELSLGTNGYAFVIEKDGTIIYHPDSEVFESVEKQMSVQDISNSPMDSMVSEDYFVHKSTIGNGDWVLVGVSSFSSFKETSFKLLAIVSAVGIVSLMICMFGIYALIRYQLLPVKKIEKLMQDEKEQEALTRVYELKALTSQINPHFLYNTLETIIWMAEFQDHKKVVEITKALSNYFRLSLNAGNELVTLQQEIEHVRQYLFIQKERYGDKLNYRIDFSEEIPPIMIPKIVIQPLVENAIYHGIKEIDRPGQIDITLLKIDEWIEICIADNGVGMSGKETSSKQLGGIGIKNVTERLKLFFGEAFTMTIDSKPNEYTKVYLRIPIKR